MKPLFIVLFLGYSVMGLCQETKTVNPGLKLGAGFSSLTPDYTDSNGYKHNFTMTGGVRFGGFIQIPAGRNFLFQPEIQFVVKGTKENTQYNNGNPVSDYPIRINYIEIPLNMLAKLPSKSGGFFSIGGGPALAFSSNIYTEYATRFDIGLNVLAAWQLPIGVSINLSFTKGFSNVLEEIPGAASLKNSSIGFCVGYSF